MEIRYLTTNQIILINRWAVEKSGDPFVLENESSLEHLVEAIKYKYADKVFEESLVLKAAFILDMIANKGHIFVEGNKRTAITSTIAFLDLNGYRIDTSNQDELVAFVRKVARGELSLRAISKWLQDRIKKRV